MARAWLTFILFGGLIWLGVFLGMVFGLQQSEDISSIVASVLGLSLGYGLANLLIARRLAARFFRILGFIEWHLK
ncbi:MAG: hypothetical protein AAGL97_13035 [Pseudomonadota bacterium]